MIFISNFASLLPNDKSKMSYQEFLKKVLMNFKYQEIEYKEEIEPLIKSIYEKDEASYKKLYKAFGKVPYTIVMEYYLEIDDLLNNEDINSLEELVNFSEVCKKAGSIINRVFESNYIEFMNNEYSEKEYDKLVELVNSITEDNSEILEKVCSEFDDYLYERQASPTLMNLADCVREKFPERILNKGKKEVTKFYRLIDYKTRGNDLQALRTHVELEKRRKHARYN